MTQPGFFDFQDRVELVDNAGNPLAGITELIDWETFRPILTKARPGPVGAGRKPFDPVLMFRILVLQSLYNLSDDGIEFQIKDRISFMVFCGIDVNDCVPDSKTVWLFRENLTKANILDDLFALFNATLNKAGYTASKGQIVDASIIPARIQRNTRLENQKIKEGVTPGGWSEVKKRQKDVDARWVKKNGKSTFGYKNHINIDVEHKFIRQWEMTTASSHDSQTILIDPSNSGTDFFGDSAYNSGAINKRVVDAGLRDRTHHKARRNRKLSKLEKEANKKRSSTRVRVEHVFGVQTQKAAGNSLLIRTIGKVRAETKIGLRNLAYNMVRHTKMVAQI